MIISLDSEFLKRASRTLAIFSFAAATSAGQASFSKFGIPVNVLLIQARAPCVLAGLGYLLFAERTSVNPVAVKLATVLAVLCAFLAVNTAVRGIDEFQILYIVDLAYLAMLGYLSVFLIRDEQDLTTLCMALIVIAIPFVPVWYARADDTYPGFTTITYFRIEFFAYMACTLLAIKGTKTAWPGAAFFLFLTIDSTSKAAAILAPVVVAYLGFVLAIDRPVLSRPFGKSALPHLALLVVVLAIFIPTRSGTIVSRLEAVSVERGAPATKEALNNLYTFNDGTQRVRMAVHAIDLAKQNRFFGTGVGAYSISLMNSARNGFDVYRYPHNVTLEILYSAGLLGITIYGASVAAFLLYLYRSMARRPHIVALAMGAIFTLLSSSFAGDFYDMRMFWLLTLAAVGSSATLVPRPE